jgi:hypothetical protein
MYRYSGLARPRPPLGPHANAILNASIEVKWTPRKQCDCSFARTPLQFSPGSTVMRRLSLRIQKRVNRQARGRKRHGPELDGVGGRAGGFNPGGRDGKGARERQGHARLTLAHPSADMSCQTGRESRIIGASRARASRYGLVATTSA